MVGRHRNPDVDCFAGGGGKTWYWDWMYDREHIYNLGRGSQADLKNRCWRRMCRSWLSRGKLDVVNTLFLCSWLSLYA